MTAGDSQLSNVFTVVGEIDYSLLFDTASTIQARDTLSGTILTELDIETWGPIGTTGNIFGDRFDNNVLGSYRIIDPEPGPEVIPLPAGLPLLAAGLGALALFRRRA